MTGTVQGAEDIEKLKAKLMRWTLVAPKEIEKALRIGAEWVREEAQRHHLSGPRMPRGVGSDDFATLYSSEPRHPFRLRKSIAIKVKVEPGKIQAEVGTSVPYGRSHELGLGRLPARPFLRPSLNKKHDAIFEMIRKRFFESYAK